MQERVQDFLNFLAVEKGYAANTIAAYQTDLNQVVQHLKAQSGEPPPQRWAEVKGRMLTAYLKRLGQHHAYAASTLARKVAATKSFFRFLLVNEVIQSDPARILAAPPVEKHPPATLSPAEIERLLQVPAGARGPTAQRDSAILELLYATGVEVTELISLDRSDVEFEAEGARIHVSGRGSQAKKRVIPLTGSAVTALKQYLRSGRGQLLRDPTEPALFLNNRGRRLTRQGLWHLIKRTAEAAGISSRVTPRMLRRAFAAHKLSQGKSLKEIQALLGHASRSTTRRYTDLDPEAG